MEPGEFVGSIVPVAQNYTSNGYELCDGTILLLSNYGALFSIIGTIYGGDGRNTMGLPDLVGRSPVGAGFDKDQPRDVQLGQSGGNRLAAINVQEKHMPAHTHTAHFERTALTSGTNAIGPAYVGGTIPCAAGVGSTSDPTGNIPAGSIANAWANDANNLMNAGGIADGEITRINGSVTFKDEDVNVPIHPVGENTLEVIGLDTPSLAINFLICVNGEYPQEAEPAAGGNHDA